MKERVGCWWSLHRFTPAVPLRAHPGLRADHADGATTGRVSSPTASSRAKAPGSLDWPISSGQLHLHVRIGVETGSTSGTRRRRGSVRSRLLRSGGDDDCGQCSIWSPGGGDGHISSQHAVQHLPARASAPSAFRRTVLSHASSSPMKRWDIGSRTVCLLLSSESFCNLFHRGCT